LLENNQFLELELGCVQYHLLNKHHGGVGGAELKNRSKAISNTS
jgi:hypothetical protein